MMSWVLTEDWLNVTGLSLLTIGTGAQAAKALTEYKAVLKTLPVEVMETLFAPLIAVAVGDLIEDLFIGIFTLGLGLPHRRTLKEKLARAWYVTRMSPIALAMAVIAIPRKLIVLQKQGGEVGRKAVGLARTSALWAVLMVGSALALCAAMIQLARD